MTKIEKKVEFCIFMEIIKIPSLEDILPYKSELWWNIKELESFKILASYEMFTFMNKNRIYNSRDAIRLMYQT
jgi:hypothetical protein